MKKLKSILFINDTFTQISRKFPEIQKFKKCELILRGKRKYENNTIRNFFIFNFAFIVLVLFNIIISGCGTTDNGINNQEINSASVSYSGEISVLIDGLTYHELINVSFRQSSEITGSYFQFSDGVTGLFTGSKTGNEYQISGSFDNYHKGSFNGVITTISDNEIYLEIEGNNGDGSYFESSGLLCKINCINLEGNYLGKEKLTYTFEFEGESETEVFESSDYIYLDQQNCRVSYTVPGTETSRNGDIHSNILTFTGAFVIPPEGAALTKNEFNARVTISDQYKFTFVGEGIAEGTYEGSYVKITGNTKGTLLRHFDIALGILRGGSNVLDYIIPPELIQMKNQVLSQYPTEVVANCFKAEVGTQISKVKEWLNYFTDILETPNINVILVGHSLGADAIRNGDFRNYNLYSRISIDPINPDELSLENWDEFKESANQRHLSFPVEYFQGYYLNYLADPNDSPYPAGLLGHCIDHDQLVEEPIEKNTNHFTIVDRVIERQYVLDQVNNCINHSNNIRTRVPTINHKAYYNLNNFEIISMFNY